MSWGRSARLTLTLTWVLPRLPQLLLDPPGLPRLGPTAQFQVLKQKAHGPLARICFSCGCGQMASSGQLGQHCGTADFPPGAKSSTYNTAQKSARHSGIMFFLQHGAQAMLEKEYIPGEAHEVELSGAMGPSSRWPWGQRGGSLSSSLLPLGGFSIHVLQLALSCCCLLLLPSPAF